MDNVILNLTNKQIYEIQNSEELSSFLFQLKKISEWQDYNHKNGKIKIAQYDLNMNLIKIFNSLTDAINEYGQGVRRVVKGQQNTCKNFIFKKVNDIV